MAEKIAHAELVKYYNIEIHFLNSLEDSGLLIPLEENEIKYMLYDDLPTFERLLNWHYDLEINLPGLEVISNLLTQLQQLQEANRILSSEK